MGKRGRKPSQSAVMLGPFIDTVPITHYDKKSVKHEEYEWMWRKFVGPHIYHNMRRHTEPWKLLCSVYIEGMLLGYDIGQIKEEDSGEWLNLEGSL